MADAAHWTAPIRYAKEEKGMFLGLNSRQLNSCRVLGVGMFCNHMSYLSTRPPGDNIMSILTPDS